MENILNNHLNHLHASVVMCAYTESAPGKVEKINKSDCYRLVYVVRGKGKLDFKEESYEILSGRLYFLSLRLTHSHMAEGNEPLAYYYCDFQIGHGELSFIDSLKLPLYVQTRKERTLLGLFTKLVALQQSALLTRELRQKSVLLELFAYYLDESNQKENDPRSSDNGLNWNEVLMYIERNMHANISVDDLARVAFLHPNYFISSFKNMMGCSPIQYVNNRRIATVKLLLAGSELPVTEIARRVGLQNHYLSRLFKQHTGVTPVQYRQMTRNNASVEHHKGLSLL